MSKAQLCLIIVYNCVFGSFIHAQNLIPNPTFINSETRSSVHYPTELMRSPIVPKYWEIVDGYPDFFNDLNSTYIGYPILNTEDGIGGKLGMRMTNSDNEFEAVETMLTNELVKGEKYIISFTMAQCQYSNFSMDMIPFILSNERTSKNNIVEHTTNNLCLLETSQKYLSKDGWKTVRFVYKAKGGEKYLTLINNSYTFARHEKSKVNRTRFNFTGNKLEESSYYFFSEVLVELAAGDTDCEPFVFSPDEDITKDESFETFQTKLQALLKLDLVEVNEKRLKQEHLLNEHTIFLIDISGSMKSGFRNIKRFVLDIMDEMSDQELVSLIVFGASSKIILQRANKETPAGQSSNFLEDLLTLNATEPPLSNNNF
ncbi:MAG: VWA domain-containing protein [Crocinitomicaceae bacterium]